MEHHRAGLASLFVLIFSPNLAEVESVDIKRRPGRCGTPLNRKYKKLTLEDLEKFEVLWTNLDKFGQVWTSLGQFGHEIWSTTGLSWPCYLFSFSALI